MRLPKTSVFILLLLSGLLWTETAFSQLQRERAQLQRPVELVFPTPRHINLLTTEPLAAGELYYSIMHTFGEIDNGAGNLWGIDSGANIRFNIEYGFTDRFSLSLGRSSMDKVFELGGRYLLLQQQTGGARNMPVSLALSLSGGIMTVPSDLLFESFGFSDRLLFSAAMPISRAFSDRLSLLAVPMFAQFSKTAGNMRVDDVRDSWYAGLGLGSRFGFTQRHALTLQYLPAWRDTPGQFSHGFGFGIDIKTGGHVFQLFFTNTQALNDAYLLAATHGDILDGGLRFGFNINRSFVVRN